MTICYSNLRAEMGRKGISAAQMARGLGLSRDTLVRRLSQKGKIPLGDALRLQETFFPELDLRYLFDYEKG